MEYEKKRWFMLASAMLMNICIGSGYAWSVFQKPLIELYGWTPAQASLAFTLLMGISALPMVIAGMAQKWFEPKRVILVGGLMFGLGTVGAGFITGLTGLYLIYGVVAGLGMGVVYSGGVPNLTRFFPDKRGLCAGLLAAGMGSGALFLAPISARLIVAHGVLNTFKIMGLVYTAVIVILSFTIETAPKDFKPKGWEPVRLAEGGIQKKWSQMLAEPIFYVVAAMFVTGTISGLMIIAHASPIMQQVMGVTPQRAGALVGIVALANACGRVFWGFISDRVGRFPTILTMYIISALCMFGLSVVPSQAIFYLIFIVGTCFGGFMAMIASLTADTFGTKHLPVNFGIMFIGFAIAAYYGPRIAAKVKMASGGYQQAFVTAAIIAAVGILLTLIAMVLKKRRDSAFLATATAS